MDKTEFETMHRPIKSAAGADLPVVMTPHGHRGVWYWSLPSFRTRLDVCAPITDMWISWRDVFNDISSFARRILGFEPLSFSSPACGVYSPGHRVPRAAGGSRQSDRALAAQPPKVPA